MEYSYEVKWNGTAYNYSDCNSCGNGFYRHPALTITYVLLSTLVLVVGVLGNSMILVLYCRQRRMRTDTNLFIASLAVSDILICCVSPSTYFNTLLMDQQWTWGQWLCKALPTVITTAVFASSFTMTAVALNRYLLARSNRHLRCSQRCVLLTALWTASGLCSLPVALRSEASGGRCVERWGDFGRLRTAYTLSCLSVQFVLPCCVIVYCYGKLGVWLRLRAKLHEQDGPSNALTRHRNATSIRRKRCTNRMLVAIVLLYCISWLPLNVLNLLLEFCANLLAQWPFLELVYLFTQILASSSAALNPCIFALLNKDYQRHLKSYLRGGSTRAVVHFRFRVPHCRQPYSQSLILKS